MTEIAMNHGQLFLLLISIIPIANCLMIKFCNASSRLSKFFEELAPILFLLGVIGVSFSHGKSDAFLVLTEAAKGVALGFEVDSLSIKFLFLLSLFWLIFSFHSKRFLNLSETKNAINLKAFFVLIVAIVNLIIISKNLLTILFFYNFLIVACHFFGINFLHKKENKLSRFFTFLLYLESLFFFFAIVATYKFAGQIEFLDGGIFAKGIDSIKYFTALILYLTGLFLSVLLPFFLFYRDINLDLITIYAIFFLAYAFSGIYILLKILGSIFGFEDLRLMISDFGIVAIEIIFFFAMAASSIFLILSAGIRSSFFYLVFQQTIFALFSIFLFAVFDLEHLFISVLSFSLSITLVFLCISNLVLYLKKSECKNASGVFYNLKITTSLLAFALLSFIGLAPSIGGLEKFFLLKIIIGKKMLIAGAIFMINFLTLSLFSCRIFWQFFHHNKRDLVSENEIDIAKKIDLDSGLILSALLLAVLMFLFLIFNPFLIKFL
jgi:formate hydrogenlyase subunit 3/multisubunit Na+/H+ antiporter MnhD subunit